MTVTQTQTEQMMIIKDLNDSIATQQPYKLIVNLIFTHLTIEKFQVEKIDQMKSDFDKKTLDLRLKVTIKIIMIYSIIVFQGKDILKARKVNESKKEYSVIK